MNVIDNNIKHEDESSFNEFINDHGLLNSSNSRLAFNISESICNSEEKDKKKIFGLLSHLFSDKPTMRLTAEEAGSEKIFAWSDNRIGRMVRESATDMFDAIPEVKSASELEISSIRGSIASLCLSMLASSLSNVELNEFTFRLDDSDFGQIDVRVNVSEGKFKSAAADYLKNIQ